MADNGGEDPNYDPHYDPVIQLTEKVTTTTNEENEDVEFKLRAKLFRFEKTTTEWKERGTGDVKLLKDKVNGKIRLVMRRDKTLKVCANHYISSDIKLAPNLGSDRAWVYSVSADYSEGEPTAETLAIRFSNSDNANSFKEAFESAQKSNLSGKGASAAEPATSTTAATASTETEAAPAAAPVAEKAADVVEDVKSTVAETAETVKEKTTAVATDLKAKTEEAAAAVTSETKDGAAAAKAEAEDITKSTSTTGERGASEMPPATQNHDSLEAKVIQATDEATVSEPKATETVSEKKEDDATEKIEKAIEELNIKSEEPAPV